MSYDELVRSYEKKARVGLVILVVIHICILVLIFALSILTSGILAGEPDPIGILGPLAIALSFSLFFVIGEVISFKQMKSVRPKIDSMIKQAGITDCEIFAAAVSSGQRILPKTDVFINEEYLIDLRDHWATRLDHITDLDRGSELSQDSYCYYICVKYDEKSSKIEIPQGKTKEAYSMIYDYWQRAGGLKRK